MVGAVRRWMSSASGLLLLARWRVCFCFFSMDAPPSLAATLTGRARVPAVVVLLRWRTRCSASAVGCDTSPSLRGQWQVLLAGSGLRRCGWCGRWGPGVTVRRWRWLCFSVAFPSRSRLLPRSAGGCGAGIWGDGGGAAVGVATCCVAVVTLMLRAWVAMVVLMRGAYYTSVVWLGRAHKACAVVRCVWCHGWCTD